MHRTRKSLVSLFGVAASIAAGSAAFGGAIPRIGWLDGLVGARASAVDLKGTVRVPDAYVAQVPREGERRTFYWEEWNGFLEARPRKLDVRRELAVVLLGPPPPGTDNRVEVQLHGGSLARATLVVRPETILRIENKDDIAHELFAEGLDGFSAEATSSGQARTVRVTREGSFPIRDARVPHVRGHLHVLPNLAFVGSIDASGEYKFTNVPPGQYSLKVFHLDREVGTSVAVVPEATRELTLEPMVLTPPTAPAAR
jgi:hypothetical protein